MKVLESDRVKVLLDINKKVMVNIFLLTIFVVSNANAINLIQAYEAALLNDPELQVAYAEYRAGLESVKIARSGLLPKIDATGQSQKFEKETDGLFPITLDQDQNPLTAEIRSLRTVENESDEEVDSWGVSVRQPLYDSSKWFEYKRGKYQTAQSRYQLKVDQQALLFRVTKAYLEVIQAQENLMIAKKLEEADKVQLENSSKRAVVGASGQVDVYQAQAASDLSMANRMNDEDVLGRAEDQFRVITGSSADIRTFWVLNESFKPLPLTPNTAQSWLDTAVSNSPIIKVSRANKDASRAAYKSARSNHLPTVYLELAYNDTKNHTSEIDNGIPFDFDSTAQGLSMSVNLNIPIYSGGLVRAQSRQTHYQYQAAEQSYIGVLEDTKRQIKTTYREVINNINRSVINARAVTSSRKALEATQKSYNIGIGSINDLLVVRRGHYNALKNLTNTKYAYLLKLVELKQLAGTLNPSDIYELNKNLKSNNLL